MRKYQLPIFLQNIVTQNIYEKWLDRKARAHLNRDKKRGNTSITLELYKVEIHNEVCASNGLDAYTGESLDWSLISKYNNDESKEFGREYKKQFALLPTLDHVDDGLGNPNFKICSWRTNDSKNDLSLSEFMELCKKILAYNENKL